MNRNSPEICPVCGEDVPPNSWACPECGADERAGWNEDDAYVDALDLPEAESEEEARGSYQAFMEREFGVIPWKKRLGMVFGIVLVVVMAVYLIRFF
ncbi:MAG: zinc ribbon domain-containing protein [Verrucomicrobiales bacterium]